MANKVFGKRIKKIRLDNNMTLYAFAKTLNATRSRISMWETTGVVPREETLIKLSKLYNVSIDYLLGNEKMEGVSPKNKKLDYIQRSLGKLDNERLHKAEVLLKTVFDDIFD